MASRPPKFAPFAAEGKGVRALALGRTLRAAAPPLLLALAFGWAILLNADRAHYYANLEWDTAKNLAIAENLSPQHNFLMFIHQSFRDDGEPYYDLYGRFPIGGFALIKLAILPFGDNMLAKVFAARMLMLGFLAGAAFLSYLSIARIASSKWIALTATLFAFSSYYVLRYGNWVSNEFAMDLFGVMLTFHGMVVFTQEGRFRQLAIKACAALLIGWHVYALLAPFILLGLASEITRAIKTRQASPARLAGALASIALRSRYAKLGAVALLFGAGLLSFNLLGEYNARNGESPLTELPSYQVIFDRLIGGQTLVPENGFDWGAFLRQQSYRIAGASFPYALTQWPALGEISPDSRAPFLSVLGFITISAALLGALFVRRHRIALGALALSGLSWALAVRFSVAYPSHQHEAIFYAGVPLTLATLILLPARHPRTIRLLPVAAVVAFAIFTASAHQMMAKAPDEELFERREATISDLANVRSVVQGKNVVVANPASSPAAYEGHAALYFLLSGSRLRNLGDGLPVQYDFALIPHRRDDSAPTLTPNNEFLFLYEDIAPPNVDRSFLDFVVSSYRPAARATYDVYLLDGALAYVKDPCGATDRESAFFLHVFPEQAGDLPEWRKGQGFDNLDFHFPLWGASYDGACVARVPLPEYETRGVRTGQQSDGRALWETAFSFDADAPRAAYAAAASREPDARAEFNLHFDAEERTLTYVKDPCGVRDVERPFFLHVIPERESDLPQGRRASGFEARDFDFRLQGAVFDGKCAAKVALPEYAVAGVRTGQWVRGEGEAWETTLRLSR